MWSAFRDPSRSLKIEGGPGGAAPSPARRARGKGMRSTRECAGADVATVKAARPFDRGDARVSAPTRLGEILTRAHDRQHAPAIGEKARAVAPCPGLEDGDPFEAPGSLDAFDRAASREFARIAFACEHDADAFSRREAHGEFAEHAVARREHRGHEIRHEARHDDLAFGVAEAAIIFDELRALPRDHEPGVEKAAKRGAS